MESNCYYTKMLQRTNCKKRISKKEAFSTSIVYIEECKSVFGKKEIKNSQSRKRINNNTKIFKKSDSQK